MMKIHLKDYTIWKLDNERKGNQFHAIRIGRQRMTIYDKFTNLKISPEKRYRLRHPDKVKQKDKKWRDKHPEYKRDWRRENPEKVKAIYERYRAILSSLLGSRCIICGKLTKKISYHEIHGKNHPKTREYIYNHLQDFVPLCGKHHIGIHRSAELMNDKKAQALIKALVSNRGEKNGK